MKRKKKILQEESLTENQENEIEIIKNLLQESYIYSSRSTIKAISTYQQHSYRIQEPKEKCKDWENIQNLIFIPRIIKRMKYDFTGEKIDSLELLKIKISDWNLKKELIARFFVIWYFILENFFRIIVVIIAILILVISMFIIFS